MSKIIGIDLGTTNSCVAVMENGTEDFDQEIINYVVNEFKKDSGMDLKNDVLALQRLKEAAEKAKIELSSTQQTDINLPYITADASGPKHLNISITRSKLEALVDKLLEKTKSRLQQHIQIYS